MFPFGFMIPSNNPKSRCLDWEFSDNPTQVKAQNALFSPQFCSKKLDLGHGFGTSLLPPLGLYLVSNDIK